ncbi:unnamed protein product [Gordionus sp. m RMFG-2023]
MDRERNTITTVIGLIARALNYVSSVGNCLCVFFLLYFCLRDRIQRRLFPIGKRIQMLGNKAKERKISSTRHWVVLLHLVVILNLMLNLSNFTTGLIKKSPKLCRLGVWPPVVITVFNRYVVLLLVLDRLIGVTWYENYRHYVTSWKVYITLMATFVMCFALSVFPLSQIKVSTTSLDNQGTNVTLVNNTRVREKNIWQQSAQVSSPQARNIKHDLKGLDSVGAANLGLERTIRLDN